MPKKKPNQKKNSAAALLQKIGTHGWKASGATGADLPALVKFIDSEVAATFSESAPSGEAHDRLFEVMMARFDALQNYRPAFLNIISAVKQDPSLMQHLLPAHIAAMRSMLTLAKLQQQGPMEFLTVFGLMGVYAITLHSWERDTSKDMSVTMAALDRNLRRAGKLAEFLFRAA